EPIVERVILGKTLPPLPPPDPEDEAPPKLLLGIAMEPANERESALRPQGVIVTAVMPQSAASRAGIAAQNLLLRFADHDIQSMSDLQSLVKEMKPGDAVPVVILRGGEQIRMTVQF